MESAPQTSSTPLAKAAAGVTHLLTGMDVDEMFAPLPSDDEGVLSDHLEGASRSKELCGGVSLERAAADFGESCNAPPAPAAQGSQPAMVETGASFKEPLTGVKGLNLRAHSNLPSSAFGFSPSITTNRTAMRVVGIIGAGAAGLCSLRHVLNTPGIVPVIWEQSRGVGGTWVYTDQLDKDDHKLPIHSSMYRSLKTNLPKETMGFPDFPFPEEGESFVHHTQVLSYLKRYAEHFDLLKHIQFCHLVESVAPTSPGNPDTEWHVTVRDLTTQRLSTVLCHAMVVCNGHYSVPNVPEIPGMHSFTGTTQHSHSYRAPEQYRGLRVAVLGAAASGMDIALEIATVAKQVHLCHNLPIPIPSQLPANLQQVAGIEALKPGTSDTFSLKGGGEVQADALVYCTGYQYTFPFLTSECGVTVVSNQVRPLYRHLIHCSHPTMAFVGIPFQICPFPFFDVQVRYFLNTAVCRLHPLPSPEAMLEHSTRYASQRLLEGAADRHLHRLGPLQWAYCNDLLDEVGLDRINPVVEKLYDHVHIYRKNNLMTYKEVSYRMKKESFLELPPPTDGVEFPAG